ncbi:FAD/NAD(P)-binding protein [Sandarakinorhabdus glacialis]|nr:FAD/NAD(P)-binding protein [Polymorphobacter glacialis]
MTEPPLVAIIGSGFSGTLIAINLLRQPGLRVVLVDRRPLFGPGVAYSATNPAHLLNVRAHNMSAFPDQPDHFIDWCRLRGILDQHPGTMPGFVPRRSYGDYLGSILAEGHAQAKGRLQLVCADVARRDKGRGLELTLSDGSRITADSVVLATGNQMPLPPPELDVALLGDRYSGNPWAEGAASGLGSDDVLMLIGTGLTMVDAALAVAGSGFEGKMVALSRRGLVPHAHAAGPHASKTSIPTATGLVALLREVRVRAREIDWRTAIDELRPHTRALWQRASRADRARFLRHLRPWWDIHRHRLAPEVAERLAALRASGQLAVVAGRTRGFTPTDQGVEVRWRLRHAGTDRQMTVQRIVNCSGPAAPGLTGTDPLVTRLLASGIARACPSGMGLDVDENSVLRDRSGTPHPNFHALGPLTRGAFLEITAVPDIRVQAWEVARQIGNEWIGSRRECP